MKFWNRVKIVEKPIDLEHESFSRPTLVYLLGAGASKDAGFPICADLKSTEFVAPYLTGMSAEAQSAFDWLKDQEESFEVLLSRLVETEDASGIARILSFYEEIFVKAETYSSNFDQWSYLFKLIICSVFNPMGTHPVFITFNHDLILEYGSNENRRYNYGTLTNKLYCRDGQLPDLYEPGYDLTILKMHGSFNMLACDKCERIMSWHDYTWQWKNSPCSACDDGTLLPLYIPPTPFKKYDPLKDTWADAKSALRRAAFVIVIGYSLPEYDHHAITLLHETNPDAELVVIDKYATDIASRYAQFPPVDKFFRSTSAKEFCDELFEGKDPARHFIRFW
jgi:NAD-dependent SIR2 family protein deacetylase